MKKQLLKERFQQLAGITPLYKLNEDFDPQRQVNLTSIDDVDASDWSVDGGGGSIEYMEWADGTEMTPQEIQDFFEYHHDLYDEIMYDSMHTNIPKATEPVLYPPTDPTQGDA